VQSWSRSKSHPSRLGPNQPPLLLGVQVLSDIAIKKKGSLFYSLAAQFTMEQQGIHKKQNAIWEENTWGEFNPCAITIIRASPSTC